jgi:signal transduction histidine kinase
MFNSLSIFKKGLFVTAVPMFAQAVFIGILMTAQAEGVRAQNRAVHTKEVIAKVEETYRNLLEEYARIRTQVVSDNDSAADRFHPALNQIPGNIAELRALVADNPPQRSRIDELANGAKAFVDMIDSQEQLLRSGKREQAFQQLDLGARILGAVRTSTDEILAEELRLDRLRMDRLRNYGARQFWILAGGGVATLAATMVLAVLLLNGVIKRLAVLRDNTRRFAEGTGLQAPLSGRDEIALVDRAFHEMATSLDQQKQENAMFVYSVSHDLRSPLINLQGFSEELGISYRDVQTLFEDVRVPTPLREQGKKLLTENIEDSIRYIQTAVGRLARIIDALLRLSRAGRVEYRCQMVEVAAVVRKINDALHDTIAERKAEIKVHELPPAWGDPTAVEQIFANLIGNAVLYLDPTRPGKIEVGSTDALLSANPDRAHTYFVKDNGLGIPEAYHQRVFTAFNRLQANVAQGEGIGLALVRRMVERHGGKIWLESAVGAGTTFFVALPAGSPQGAESPNTERPLSFDGQRGDRSKWQSNRS